MPLRPFEERPWDDFPLVSTTDWRRIPNPHPPDVPSARRRHRVQSRLLPASPGVLEALPVLRVVVSAFPGILSPTSRAVPPQRLQVTCQTRAMAFFPEEGRFGEGVELKRKVG